MDTYIEDTNTESNFKINNLPKEQANTLFTIGRDFSANFLGFMVFDLANLTIKNPELFDEESFDIEGLVEYEKNNRQDESESILENDYDVDFHPNNRTIRKKAKIRSIKEHTPKTIL